MARSTLARKAALLALLGASAPSPASAQTPAPPRPDARAEARERFDRATRLFNEGDNAAALAELQRAYEILPSPLVLYDIGLVQAAMARPVEAVDTFDKLLAAPGTLGPSELARAKATRAAQAQRVGALSVKTNVEGASVEIDNLDAARTPLAAPLRLSVGAHVVTVVAPGYAPARRAIGIAGGATTEASVDLVPMQGRLAHLALRSRLPAAEVLVDGQLVGKTPLAGSLALAPGKHRVELRRAGYLAATHEVEIGEGSAAELALELREDPVLAPSDGTLALDLSESPAIVTLDDALRGPYTTPLHVPGGPHHLRVERAGFYPIERDVDVPAGAPVTVAVRFEPTPDTLAAFVDRTRARRVAGWVTLAGGAALTVVGVAILGYDAGQRSSDKSQYGQLTGALAARGSPCDFQNGATAARCYGAINAAADGYGATLARDAAASVVGGLGVAAMVTGIVLLATRGDPHKYDAPASDALSAARVQPSAWGLRGGGGVGLSGTF